VIAIVAAQCGLDPGPFTLRQLVAARDAKRDADWWHTSLLCQVMASGLLPKRTGSWKITDFHPSKQTAKQAITKEELHTFKEGFPQVIVKASEVRVASGQG
tara:strand:+ start:172 stop:474 length:303 start_codon:yes stop_codon:yes gene_type:complete